MTVSAAYARANLPALLKAVARGKTVTISRYNKPVADLVPAKPVEKPKPRLGTLKGKIEIIDRRVFEPMTDKEVDAFLAGRY